MDTRKESLCSLKVCRFCLTQNEPLISLYEKNKAPPSVVTLSTRILTCIGVEVFPSDKMPQYICSKCKFFMELFHGFKHVCRKSDKNILHFIQHGTPLEPLNWASLLNKVYRLHTKSEFGLVKSVTQDGATVKVSAEELLDSEEEGDDDHVYNVKIEDGSDELKRIKVMTSVDNPELKGNQKVRIDSDSDEMASRSPVVVKDGCWPCNECDCTYSLQQLLAVHKRQKHRPRNIQCDDCDAKFFSNKDLLLHQLTHSDEYAFQCVVCNKQFRRLQLLKRHEKLTHANLPQLKCTKCPATFLCEIQLDEHIMKHEANSENRRVTCTICNKRLLDLGGLQKHMATCHKKKPAFDCNYCPERFANMTKLAKHLRTHAGERPYPCKHCDKSFLKSHHYTRHLRLKHSDLILAPSDPIVEPELSYRCEECEDVFSTQDELIYHSALHATRSLTCPLCQEQFDDVDTVTTHIKSHVNGAEYNCGFCELIFTTREKLHMHTANTHENEYNDKEMTQNEEEEEEEDGESLDTEGYEDDNIDNSNNVKEDNGPMVVDIKKAGEYMLAEPEAMEDDDADDETENDPSEDPGVEITLDASGSLLALKPAIAEDTASKSPKPVNDLSSVLSAVKKNIGPSKVKNISIIYTDNTASEIPEEQKNEEEDKVQIDKYYTGLKRNTSSNVKNISLIFTGDASFEKPEEQKNNEVLINRKVEIKRKVIQHQSSPVSNSTDKKEKTNSKVESAKVESNSAAGASDLSLRLLEKELQDLQRTNTRNEVSKTTAKPETLRSKRSQIHTSTPKPRAAEKKEAAPPKSAPEKPVQEKRPPGRPPKENKEAKNASAKEDKEAREKANASLKEDKETKEAKEKETQVIKNGGEEITSTEEPVRRSSRPSKVKDYAKMISDSPDDEEESSEEEPEEEEPKGVEKNAETPRRGRKSKQPAAPTPASAPRKRGRPRRKEPSPIPSKITKIDESEDEDDPEPTCSTTKPEDKDTTLATEDKTSQEPKASVSAPVDPATNVILSPSGPLKKVTIKALPPGVKPMPLPRKLPPSVTEMQIGKKMVKVQKIVMTKAEVEAMTKKGLVEMKDGTIVLKPGIKLPSSSAALKSPGSSQEKREIPPPRPTRCDLGDD